MTDYIDKAEVLRLIEEHKSIGYEMKDKTASDAYAEFYLLAHDHIKEVIERFVFPADVAPVKRGKWIKENDRPKSWLFVCSLCGGIAYYPNPKFRPKGCGYKFCPNCGADMREE